MTLPSRSANGEDDVTEGLEFAGAMYHRVTGKDLLHQRRSRARHADHEDGHRRGVATTRFRRDQFAREDRLDTSKKASAMSRRRRPLRVLRHSGEQCSNERR